MSVKAINKNPNTAPSSVPLGWSLVGCLPPGKTLVKTDITLPTVKIGRLSSSDLCLKSQRVSGAHAELLFIGETLFIRDLKSTNGTFLNRKRVTQPMPVSSGDHIELADMEFRVQYTAPVPKRDESTYAEFKKTVKDLVTIDADWILSQFNDLISQRRVTPYYQAILDFRQELVVGYEALARSEMAGLENPGKMFHTAELVNQEVDLSILCRERAIEFAHNLGLHVPIFVNTHQHEDMDRDVLPSLRRSLRRFPGVSVVVEFHEKTIQSASTMLENKKKLKEIGVKVAYDDFGAGQSRLLELMKAPPDYLKFDRCLIQDVHQANPYQHRMLKSLIETAHEVGIVTLAEGIEVREEAEFCREIGFDLAQGFFFGYPKPNPTHDAEESFFEFA
ncbi:EAL domain-containing protein [Thalassoglobus sp.]|uniref:EAL domain-containing protein n=1 Tax=Thalassoglobus sp. TaxID=2795869 RepID=UPI003AA826F4